MTTNNSEATNNAAASYRVSHVEWEVPDGEQSAAFLSQLLGWEFRRFSTHYWLYEAQNDVAVGLHEKTDCERLTATCPVFIDVPDVAASVQRALALGAELIEAKTEIVGYGAWAKIKEPGGNAVGLFERS